MKKLQTFFYSLKRSLFDPSYYRDILNVPFSFSFKYLFTLLFFLVLIQSIQFSVVVAAALPKVPAFLTKVEETARNAYPSELVVRIINGEVSTNVQEPYFIDLPPLTQSMKEDEAPTFEHLVTIDTQATADDYKSYRTLFLLTKNAVVYPDRERGQLTTYKVTDLRELKEPVVINHVVYQNVVNKLLPYVKSIPTILGVLIVLALLVWPFVGSLLITLGKMSYLSFTTILLWIVAKAMSTGLSYRKIYQLGMHGLSLPILVTSLLALFGTAVPYMYTAGFLLWMVIILSKLKQEHKIPS